MLRAAEVCALVLLLFLASKVCTYLDIANQKLELVIAQASKETIMQEIVTTYSAEIGTMTVRTVRKTDEGADEFANRHKVAVLETQTLFPKVQ